MPAFRRPAQILWATVSFVGESIIYDGVVNLSGRCGPEPGNSQDLIPPGLELDHTFNNGKGFQIITTAVDSGGSCPRTSATLRSSITG